MTYQEIKDRLTKCESTLTSLKAQTIQTKAVENKIKTLSLVKESLHNKLNLLEGTAKTYLVTPKQGQTTAVSLGDDERDALKDADDVKAIKGVDGEEIKEEVGDFTVDQTKAIAKQVGAAVAKALKVGGEEIASMKGKHIEENSFDIYVQYKNNSDDSFSFHIEKDKLILADFSFSKEMGEVGIKPSGEAIVMVDVIADNLNTHFKSLNTVGEQSEDQSFFIEVSVRTARKALDILNDMFRGQYETEGSNYYVFADEQDGYDAGLEMASRGIELEDTNIEGLEEAAAFDGDDEAAETDFMTRRRETNDYNEQLVREKGTVSEGPYQTTYIKVAKSDYKKAMAILDPNLDSTYVKTDIVDDDGDGNVIIYFNFRSSDDGEPDEDVGAFIYDVAMDLQANGINPTSASHDIEEATDINDPVLMKLRAQRSSKKASPNRETGTSPKKKAIIDKLKAKRAQVMRDMEQEAEPQGGPIADKYGDILNKIDSAIAKASGRKQMSYDDAIKEDDKFAGQDPKAGSTIQGTGYNWPMSDATRARKEADKAKDKEESNEDIDVGHQDDEPNMLVKDIYDIATYAAKLHKRLKKYDQHDGEVDFPQWWQKKIILARDYISAASHYLEGEENQPALDQLALESDNLGEKKRPGLWANINAKKKRGAKASHGNSNAHKDAVAAGNAMKKEGDIDKMPHKLLKEYGSNDIDELTGAIGYRHLDHFFEDNPGATQALQEWLMDIPEFEKRIEDAFEEDHRPSISSLIDAIEYDDFDQFFDDNPGGVEVIADWILSIPEFVKKLANEYTTDELENFGLYDVDGYDSEDNEDDLDEGVAKTKKAYDKVVTIMKDLAKQYKGGDKSVVDQLKTLTITKKKLEAMLVKDVAGTGVDQELDEAGPGFAHDCAAKVVHETYGKGKCIPEKHTLVKEGKKYVVTHYDVLFENGKTVQDIPVDELDIKTTNEHWHKGYKKKKK